MVLSPQKNQEHSVEPKGHGCTRTCILLLNTLAFLADFCDFLPPPSENHYPLQHWLIELMFTCVLNYSSHQHLVKNSLAYNEFSPTNQFCIIYLLLKKQKNLLLMNI